MNTAAAAITIHRNTPGRLVRVEFVRVPAFESARRQPRPTVCQPGAGEYVAFFFDDGLRTVVVRTYQPGRGD